MRHFFGGVGMDSLCGNDGKDMLIGRSGDDTLSNGTGFLGGGQASGIYTWGAADTLIDLDTNGDGLSDQQILLQGDQTGLSEADFVLAWAGQARRP